MATFTNQELMEKVVPALRTVSGLKLTPALRLRVLQIRRVLEPQVAMLNEIRSGVLLTHAILKDGKLVMKADATVVFAPDAIEHLARQQAFSADMKEVLEQTFKCDVTIEYGDFDEVAVTGNVLFDLGELLVLPTKPEEPEESEEAPDE